MSIMLLHWMTKTTIVKRTWWHSLCSALGNYIKVTLGGTQEALQSLWTRSIHVCITWENHRSVTEPPWLTPGAFANIFMQVTQTSIPIIHNPEIRLCFLILAALLLLDQGAVHNKKQYLRGIYHPVSVHYFNFRHFVAEGSHGFEELKLALWF